MAFKFELGPKKFRESPVVVARSYFLAILAVNAGINFEQRQNNGDNRFSSVVNGALTDNADDILDAARKLPLGSWANTASNWLDDKDLPDIDKGGEGALASTAEAYAAIQPGDVVVPLPDRAAVAVVSFAVER